MKKILIIDDEKTVSAALTFALERVGHQIVEIQNPLDVLAKLKEENFHLLILDYNINFLSGADIIKLIKNNNIHIPIVIISSQNAEEIISLKFSINTSIVYLSKDQPILEIVKEIEKLLLIANQNQYQGGSYAEN